MGGCEVAMMAIIARRIHCAGSELSRLNFMIDFRLETDKAPVDEGTLRGVQKAIARLSSTLRDAEGHMHLLSGRMWPTDHCLQLQDLLKDIIGDLNRNKP